MQMDIWMIMILKKNKKKEGKKIMSIKDAMTNITISVAEYKRLLKIEQHMNVVKSLLETDSYFNNDDIKAMIRGKKEGEE